MGVARPLRPPVSRANSTAWLSEENGRYFKQPIPGVNGMQYTFPNPVPCAMFSPWDYFIVEVFDEGRFPHTSTPVQVYGDCQP